MPSLTDMQTINVRKICVGRSALHFLYQQSKKCAESLEEDKEFLFYIWLTYDNTFFRNWRFFNDC